MSRAYEKVNSPIPDPIADLDPFTLELSRSPVFAQVSDILNAVWDQVWEDYAAGADSM